MPYAIRMHEAGGPEVLKWEEVEVADPGEGEIRLRQTAAGLNFADTKRRGDTTQTLDQPVIPGGEGAGVVQAVGAGVSEIKVGRRIAYVGVPGSYAEERVIPAAAAIPLPDGISDEIAAAMMLKGMTAHMLLFKSYLVAKGDTILVHAAAGGVGSILCQWAKHLGATVIGTVSSAEKAKLIVKLGCDHAINYASENFEERVKDITGGDGVAAVYDSIGKDT
ncbi:MAG: quinone oxidoreductase, partial [Rhodospirillales bacterium]|nr:quinone oxidoreductase [Rhodospirillales bacterium]